MYTYRVKGSRPTSNWELVLDVCTREILDLPEMSSIIIWRSLKDSEDYLPYYLFYTNQEGQVRYQALEKE
jgi:hypothetical protein